MECSKGDLLRILSIYQADKGCSMRVDKAPVGKDEADKAVVDKVPVGKGEEDKDVADKDVVVDKAQAGRNEVDTAVFAQAI